MGIVPLQTFLLHEYLNFLGAQVGAYLVILGVQVVKLVHTVQLGEQLCVCPALIRANNLL